MRTQEVERSSAIVLPDSVKITGAKAGNEKTEIQITNQDIGIFSQHAKKIHFDNVTIVRTESSPAAHENSGARSDPSDYASIYVSSDNGLVLFQSIEGDNASGDFSEAYQKYSFVKVIGAEKIVAADVTNRNGT